MHVIVVRGPNARSLIAKVRRILGPMGERVEGDVPARPRATVEAGPGPATTGSATTTGSAAAAAAAAPSSGAGTSGPVVASQAPTTPRRVPSQRRGRSKSAARSRGVAPKKKRRKSEARPARAKSPGRLDPDQVQQISAVNSTVKTTSAGVSSPSFYVVPLDDPLAEENGSMKRQLALYRTKIAAIVARQALEIKIPSKEKQRTSMLGDFIDERPNPTDIRGPSLELQAFGRRLRADAFARARAVSPHGRRQLRSEDV